MPIPPDLGEALTDYIRQDRVSTSRALFVTARAPHGPFKDGQVLNTILKKAFARTGVTPPCRYVGSHILRHSLATNLIRQGASLPEVSDMLRHRSRASTMIYAKLDIEGLRSIAQPWPVSGRRAMSRLAEELDRYLTIRRSLGYDLGTTTRVLRRFIAFAERQGAEHVGTDLFLRWQGTFGRAGRQTWAARLGMVRLFAQWLHGLDPAHEVPPQGLIPNRYRRSRPYIYSDAGDRQHRRRRGRAPLGLRSARAHLLDPVRADRDNRAQDQRSACASTPAMSIWSSAC